MYDLFLADAHLVDPADANYRRLVAFLDAQQGQVRTLYLLGDIFEFWIGYRHAVFAAYVPLLEALRRFRDGGARIVYVEGNHDFHLGPYLREVLGCTVLPDGGIVEIDGKRVLLVHGDLINPADTGYRFLRRVLRSAPLRWLLPRLHPDLAWSVARWAGRKSQQSHGVKRKRWDPADLLKTYAADRFAAGCDAVVCGHFHTPLLEERDGKTLVALGGWIEQDSYAVLAAGVLTLKGR